MTCHACRIVYKGAPATTYVMSTMHTAIDMMVKLGPYVHPLDAERAMSDLVRTISKYNARRLYHDEMTAATVKITDKVFPRVNRRPEDGPVGPYSPRTIDKMQADLKPKSNIVNIKYSLI